MKQMSENLRNELYYLEKKQSKSAKLRVNIKWKLKGKKCSKTFFKALEKQNIQNQTISELYIDAISELYTDDDYILILTTFPNWQQQKNWQQPLH